MKRSLNNSPDPSPFLVSFTRFLCLVVSKIFWRIEFRGTGNIPESSPTGLLITPNHQTYFDPFWVSLPVKKDLRFMAWDEAFRWFFVGRLIGLLGAFPVSLKRGGSIKALKDSLKFLREGKTLLIFPEGEREFSDGKLLPFKTGAVRLAMEAEVPILPVSICGGNRVWPRGRKIPRPGKVLIRYHPPITVPKPRNERDVVRDAEEISRELAEIIAPEQ